MSRSEFNAYRREVRAWAAENLSDEQAARDAVRVSRLGVDDAHAELKRARIKHSECQRRFMELIDVRDASDTGD